MKRLALSIVVLLTLILPVSVQAQQGGIQLGILSVQLLSEFDQPSMLVINEFALTPNTTLPVQIKWRYPKDANLVAVAYDKDGILLNSSFESSAEQGNWQTISMKVDSYNTYHIEYYQELSRNDKVRSFTYKWIGDYDVNELRLSVSLPADSMSVKTTPALSMELQTDRGLLVGSATNKELKMGNSFQLDLEYTRDSDKLADLNQANQVAPSEPLSPDTAGRVSIDNLPWIIGGFGIILIGVALFIYWRSTRTNSSPSTRQRRKRKNASSEGEDEQPVYCHECGTRAQNGDRFCRTCGSRLRLE